MFRTRFAARRSLLLLTLAASVAAGLDKGLFAHQTGAGASSSVPANSVRQNFPCADQPKSATALRRLFNKGRIPSPAEMTGSWVAISFFGDDGLDLNCTGLKRANKFEEVMLAKGYAIEMHVIGTAVQSPMMERDNGAVTFPFEFGGDAIPFYRCRITAGKTLVCTIDRYRQIVEFKKTIVKPEEIYSNPER